MWTCGGMGLRARWAVSIVCKMLSFANHKRPSGDTEEIGRKEGRADCAPSRMSSVLTCTADCGCSNHSLSSESVIATRPHLEYSRSEFTLSLTIENISLQGRPFLVVKNVSSPFCHRITPFFCVAAQSEPS